MSEQDGLQKIGFENPESLASFVAFFEIACGALLLIGFTVRISAIPLLIINDNCNHNNQDTDLAGQGILADGP
ncbi:MAG: DoxX family protein [Marinilabiliales bacterium]|nr:DoxX family protein [Marinilabiliales bacterium]